MTEYTNGILLLPETIQLLRILPNEELGEVMKAVLLHATGVEPDEETFSSDKIRLSYEIIRNQIDTTKSLRPVKSWKECKYEKR